MLSKYIFLYTFHRFAFLHQKNFTPVKPPDKEFLFKVEDKLKASMDFCQNLFGFLYSKKAEKSCLYSQQLGFVSHLGNSEFVYH